MRHLRQVDGSAHTVVMVQVENEIGMIPEARDHSAAADAAFTNRVPAALLDYLQGHREALHPDLVAHWSAGHFATSGTWTEVFGAGIETEELFMAWHYARYVERIAAAGKAAYPLPMYVTAALVRPGSRPGQYPSAGPLPHLIDIWRAGAPSIDFLAPDIYFPNFVEWARAYDGRATRCSFPKRAERARPRLPPTHFTPSGPATRWATVLFPSRMPRRTGRSGRPTTCSSGSRR